MCFGCSPGNNIGLKLTFEEDDEKLYATWQPDPLFQGYLNVLHGGIIATLLDEAGAWCVYVKAGTAGVTSSFDCKVSQAGTYQQGEGVSGGMDC